MISYLRTFLRIFNIGITRHSTLDKLIHESDAYKNTLNDLNILSALNSLNADNANSLITNLSKSKSQICQDLFVLSHFNFKRNGYFVEFGATNGIDFSNTYLMEKEFNWNGILAEPGICWHKDLVKNRACNIDTGCVWSSSQSSLPFREADISGLSTIEAYANSDHHKVARKRGKNYFVDTISLNDLLNKYDAPHHIDYLSIDTEGSEFEILSNFDFFSYNIEVISCEHNYSPMREKIFSLLISHGYRRIFKELSFFDDYYIK
jgi:FkbM family methyltransferase